MTPHLRRKKRVIRQYAIGWPIGLVFLVCLRTIGTTTEGSFDPGLGLSLLIAMGFGLFFGVISGYFQFIIEERLYKRASIRKIIFLKFLYLTLFLLTIIVTAYLFTTSALDHQSTFLEFAFDKGSGVTYAYILLFDNFMLLLRQVNLMLGEGNLTKIITGQFYKPFEEERIFMFIDLQSSTTHAEKLGHVKYSLLLQDCFNDLSVIDDYRAQIYQYVGDEAVVSWKYNEGLNEANCLGAFYAFQERIEHRKNYYQSTYGFVPTFKAGVNCGKVTTTEVGRYKREIAYHGDVLNTAARIQAKCNELNEELLISKAIYLSLQNEPFKFEHKGEIALKGKKNPLVIYGVSQQ